MKCGSRDLSRRWWWVASSSTTNSSDEDRTFRGLLSLKGSKRRRTTDRRYVVNRVSGRAARSLSSIDLVDERGTKCQVVTHRFAHDVSRGYRSRQRRDECGSTLLLPPLIAAFFSRISLPRRHGESQWRVEMTRKWLKQKIKNRNQGNEILSMTNRRKWKKW